MNKIDQRIEKIRRAKRMGLMTHVVVGYPSLELSQEIVQIMVESSVDFIELQIPFSDPLADGPTIMKACEVALTQGTKVRDAFALAKRVATSTEIPILFMAYYNTVFRYGVERFCADAKAAGISGLIVPDVPIEEEPNEHFLAHCDAYGLYPIRVISPATTMKRLAKNLAIAKGLIYCTARQGITGAKGEVEEALYTYLANLKLRSAIPVAVGFGLSKPDHIRLLNGHADIAVVGSALIDIIRTSSQDELQVAVQSYLRTLQNEL